MSKVKKANVWEHNGISREQFVSELTKMVEEDSSIPLIAAHFDVSNASISVWMKKLGLKRRGNLRDPNWLQEQYEKGLSSIDIANLCGVSDVAVRWHMEKNGIDRRTPSEYQTLANKKRELSPLHRARSKHMRGYCFYYRGFTCHSIAEYIWLRDMLNDGKIIRQESFILNNKKPDFLCDNVVTETKDKRKHLTSQQHQALLGLGAAIKENLGYDYEIRFIADENPEEYNRVRKVLRGMGATPGCYFTLLGDL